jgi:peroxiredoxin
MVRTPIELKSFGGTTVALIIGGIVLPWLIVLLFAVLGAWIGFQLVHQNGRLLSRLEGMEQHLQRLSSLPAAPRVEPAAVPAALAPAAPAPSGLPVGSPASAFELRDLNGVRKRLADFQGKKLLLIFFNPRCGFCTRMAPDLARLPVDGGEGQPIPLVVTTGDAEENRKLFAEHGVRCPVLLQNGMEIASQYQCHGTPMGYLIDEQVRIASAQAVGADALLALREGPATPLPANGNGHAALGGTRTVAETKIQRNGLPVGTPAPDFTLPLLNGGELSLSKYRGRKVLLVFSDPKCGPCEALIPQLERQYRASDHVQVLMVSRGDEEANRAKVGQHGLTFPVVLQRHWEISREYAMFGTPAAYLIDEAGAIAAEPVTGAEPILTLLDRAASMQARERRCKCGKLLPECPKGDCDCKRQKGKVAAVRRDGRS